VGLSKEHGASKGMQRFGLGGARWVVPAPAIASQVIRLVFVVLLLLKRLNVTLNEYYLQKTTWEKFEDLRTMYLCKTPKIQWEKIGEDYNIEM
jgi:hypothetical protein